MMACRMAQRLALARPFDGHLHLRDGAAMADVVGHSARVFAGAVVMPNLVPPITTTEAALAYRRRILAALPAGATFVPLMTLFLSDQTPVEEIGRATASGVVVGAKLYPMGATTHSDAGVTDVERIAAVLEAMQEHDLPLLVHGEVTDPEVDVFDRERLFVDRVLVPLVERFQGLRVVLEHVSTAEGVQFVASAPPRVAATVTAHHLLLNRNALFAGGLDPHHYCLPVLKAEPHRRAVLAAATGDDPRFFLGTDSAPHPRAHKERRGGAAGIFTAHAALELYAGVFQEAGALKHLEAFACLRGPRFYRLPPASGRIVLERRSWRVPSSYPFAEGEVIPLGAATTLSWRVTEQTGP